MRPESAPALLTSKTVERDYAVRRNATPASRTSRGSRDQFKFKADSVPGPLARDRIEAAKNIVMMDVALLNAEIKRHVQEARRNPRRIRYEPLAPDVRAVIVQSWRNFGLLPAAPIEEMVPEKAIRRY